MPLVSDLNRAGLITCTRPVRHKRQVYRNCTDVSVLLSIDKHGCDNKHLHKRLWFDAPGHAGTRLPQLTAHGGGESEKHYCRKASSTGPASECSDSKEINLIGLSPGDLITQPS